MSIASQLQALESNISDAYDMVSQRGGTVPQRKNMENLDDAIATIPSGGGSTPDGWIPREVVQDVYGQKQSASFTFKIPNGVDIIDAYALYYAFGKNQYSDTQAHITSIDFNGIKYTKSNACTYIAYGNQYLTSITGLDQFIGAPMSNQTGGFQYAFYNCTNLTGAIDLSSFTGIPTGATFNATSLFSNAFYGTGITSVDISSFNPRSTSYGSVFQNAFYNCQYLTTVDLSGVQSILGSSTFSSAFYGDTALTNVDLSNLQTINGNSACSAMFQNCTALQSIDLSSLTQISRSSSCSNMFNGCTNLSTVDLSGLTTMTDQSCNYMFKGCSSLTSFTFDSLNNLQYANGSLNYMFQNCTSLTTLSFPALTATSFNNGNYTNQFNNMLSGCSDVTVHFPAVVQSIIGSWSSVTSGFGGTNTTVLYDL